MIAIDSSSFIAFFEGAPGTDVGLVQQAIAAKSAILPPVVLAELFSNFDIAPEARSLLLSLPLLPFSAGYWLRAGEIRRQIFATGRRARLGDALIAQSCIDANVSLITRDRDFLAFAQNADLRLHP